MHVHEVVLAVDTARPPASGKDVGPDEPRDRPVLETSQEPAVGLVAGPMRKEKRLLIDSSHQRSRMVLLPGLGAGHLFHGLPMKTGLGEMSFPQTGAHHHPIAKLGAKASEGAASRFQIASGFLGEQKILLGI